jgi:hypothetical protein
MGLSQLISCARSILPITRKKWVCKAWTSRCTFVTIACFFVCILFFSFSSLRFHSLCGDSGSFFPGPLRAVLPGEGWDIKRGSMRLVTNCRRVINLGIVCMCARACWGNYWLLAPKNFRWPLSRDIFAEIEFGLAIARTRCLSGINSLLSFNVFIRI